MKKIILGLAATAAIATATIAGAGTANAATAPVNHGQCVSSAVKAGVQGDAFKAIAQNNSLVGLYGSATCPAPAVVVPAQDKADGTLTWKVTDAIQGSYTVLTGTTDFTADANGGAVHFTATDDHGTNYVMNGVVTPGTYHKIDPHTAVFSGTIVDGSNTYTVDHVGADYFTVKVVDSGTPDGQGDMIAVLNNEPGYPDADTTIAYPMEANTAGIVQTGNIVIA